MTRLDLVRALEERCFNAWPALSTVLIDGWVVRLSDGHTRRANSASALSPSQIAPEKLIETVEALFAARGLAPLFRLTSLADPAVERALAARGWREEEPSFGMLADLDGPARGPTPDVTLSPRLSEGWIDGAMAAYGKGPAGAASLRRMLPNIAPAHVYAIVEADGAPAGWGLAVADRGYVGLYDLVVADAARGRGAGTRMIRALLDWGRAQGARAAYLQVREPNVGARALYRRLGFRDAYRYTHSIPG